MTTISINGTSHNIDGESLDHEEICRLAGQPTHASVVYSGPRRGDSQRIGTSYVGKSVALEDGMTFDAVVTGSA